MMNLSDLVTEIKMDIGIYGMTLPFEKPDDAIKDVIRLKTVPTYSRYSPYRLDVPIDGKDLKLIYRFSDYVMYQLPDLFGDRKIITIDEIVPNILNMGAQRIYGPMEYSVCDMNTMMLNAQKAQLQHFVAPKFSFEFVEPNKIKLFNAGYISRGIICYMGVAHDANLSTIDEGHSESFKKLALLDVKRFLYQVMRNYDEIQTAYGNIRLRTDEWSGAEGDRADLLSRWDEVYHLEGQQLYYL